MEKDFKNIVVINCGHNYNENPNLEELDRSPGLVRNKWFDYVVSDNAISSLKEELEKKSADRSKLQKIVYDDVINDANVVYSSNSVESAFDQAKMLSENHLVIELE